MLLGWKNISDSDVLGPALEADCRLFASHPTVPWCPGSDAAAQAQCSDLTVAPWSFLATRPSTLSLHALLELLLHLTLRQSKNEQKQNSWKLETHLKTFKKKTWNTHFKTVRNRTWRFFSKVERLGSFQRCITKVAAPLHRIIPPRCTTHSKDSIARVANPALLGRSKRVATTGFRVPLRITSTNLLIGGSLEVKLPTIWTDEKQSRAEAERRGRLEERRSEEKESEERRYRCAKR